MTSQVSNSLKLLSRSQLRELTKLSPTKSYLAILIDWSIVVGSIAMHQIVGGVLVWVIAWLLISSRLYAFYSLLHEAIHYLLAENRKLNDFVAQLFLGLPLFVSVDKMRIDHFDHHKFLQTENDPEYHHLQYKEYQYPKSLWALLLLFTLDLTGINFVRYKVRKIYRSITNGDYRSFTQSSIVFMITYTALFLSSIWFGFWQELMIYWLVPYATLYQLLNRLRLTSEHLYIDTTDAFPTRTVIQWAPIGHLVAPHNIGYHNEHHLYPGVPFYNLPALHAELVESEDYCNSSNFESSYVAIFKKLLK